MTKATSIMTTQTMKTTTAVTTVSAKDTIDTTATTKTQQQQLQLNEGRINRTKKGKNNPRIIVWCWRCLAKWRNYEKDGRPWSTGLKVVDP